MGFVGNSFVQRRIRFKQELPRSPTGPCWFWRHRGWWGEIAGVTGASGLWMVSSINRAKLIHDHEGWIFKTPPRNRPCPTPPLLLSLWTNTTTLPDAIIGILSVSGRVGTCLALPGCRNCREPTDRFQSHPSFTRAISFYQNLTLPPPAPPPRGFIHININHSIWHRWLCL